jgi:hypothetical protein
MPETGEVLTAPVAADGTWRVTPTQALPDGTTGNATVTATDPAGNVSEPTNVPLTIDASAPAAPAAELAAASDSGARGDGVTNDTTPTLSGSGTPGDTITVTMPETGEVLTAPVAADGTWRVTPTQALPDGTTGNATVTATDPAGNVSEPTNVPLTIDASAPAAPAAELAAASDSGARGDGVTNDTTPTLSGNGTPGDTITVTMPETGEVLTAPAAADGTWRVTPTQALPDGTTGNATVTATDPAGNVSAPTNVPLTIDASAPAAPAAELAAASDSGARGDGVTNDTTPTLSGSGTPGDTITVTMPETGEVLTAPVAADGTWRVTPTQALPDGTTGNATVTATDPAGNVSAPTNVPLTIDASAPAAPAAELAAASDSGAEAMA